MAIIYSQDVYNLVTKTKQENEEYINELQATLNNSVFDDKIQILEEIDALKVINIEYEKYIIIYNSKLEKSPGKTKYTIMEGDTLPRIAHKITGDWRNWQEIYTYNDLNDLKLMPGDILEIPESF